MHLTITRHCPPGDTVLMLLSSGTRLGVYEITGVLGAGSMGEVYRARDTRLNRAVAVKLLKESLADDGERLARFETEARAAAALNHPNILAVHDIGRYSLPGSSKAVPFIVSELLEGDALRDVIRRGAIPLDKAIYYAAEVARGLAAAHHKGIVHRDLKPENIFVTAEGRVKILDFGVAKVVEADVALADASASPTQFETQAGAVFGTAPYMAPEQLRGLAVDRRTDIFACGAVLYEMLAERRAFTGDTAIDTITAILKEDPPVLPLRERHIPLTVERIVFRCLEKNPASRFQSADDLAFALDSVYTASHPTGNVPRDAASLWRIPALIAIAVLVAAAAAIAVINMRRPSDSAGVGPMRVDIVTPQTAAANSASIALSPDGRFIVFAARDTAQSPQTLLWIRSLQSGAVEPLPGSEGGENPFWSPDSRSIGFLAGSTLKRVDIGGGDARTLREPAAGEGTWSSQGVIVIGAGAGAGSGLIRVSESGGEAMQLTTPTAEQTQHGGPQFLPDGRNFLYRAAGGTAPGVYLASLDRSDVRRLLNADTGAVYASPGYLLFVRDDVLYAQPFDAARLQLTGDPVQLIAERPAVVQKPIVSVSETGVLAYRVAPPESFRQLVWFDRAGMRLGEATRADESMPNSPELSPDGKWIAVTRTIDGNQDIWLVESSSGVQRRFTFNPGNDNTPVWSPDGSRVAFASLHGRSVLNIYQKLASGTAADEVLFESSVSTNVHDWSRDGRFLLIRQTPTGRGRDLLAVLLVNGRRIMPIANTPFEERDGQFSPDGQWVTYASNESGRYEIYVQAFPEPKVRRRISPAGGHQPRWRGDGRELFYLTDDGTLTAVPIAFHTGPETLDVGAPQLLFKTGIVAVNPAAQSHQYSTTPDGARFVVNTNIDNSQQVAPITLIVNWMALTRGP